VELGPQGVTSNAICPGYFATELNTALVNDPEFNAMVTNRTPLGRWGREDELGPVAVFLASDASSYVNGHLLVADGGMTAAL
jgi:gluconate 5-dehydrogenase